MSIWGAEPSENDDAIDWLNELLENPDLEMLEEALLEVADPARVGYIEIPEAAIAVVAADVFGHLSGKSGSRPILEPDETRPLEDLLKGQDSSVLEGLCDRALFAVRRVMEDEEHSELRQVWDEHTSGTENPWMKETRKLEKRLETIKSRF